MFVIGVYDISIINHSGEKRLPKIMKIMRQYLHHTQKSVFEGEITTAKFFELNKKLEKFIDKNFDYVVFYQIDNPKNIKRTTIGLDFNPNNTII